VSVYSKPVCIKRYTCFIKAAVCCGVSGVA